MINDSINRFLGVLCFPFVSMEIFQEDFISKYIREIRKGGHPAGEAVTELSESAAGGIHLPKLQYLFL